MIWLENLRSAAAGGGRFLRTKKGRDKSRPGLPKT